jgi:preprotein translocase subunit YajC
LGQLIVIVAIFVLLWFLLIRPARRRQVEQQQLVSGVQVGDEILTAGGVYGFVREVDDDELRVEVAPEVELRVARRAVAAVIPPEEEVLEAEIVEDEPVEGSQSANPNDANRG